VSPAKRKGTDSRQGARVLQQSDGPDVEIETLGEGLHRRIVVIENLE
jgi:hypothetical protein